MSKENRDVVVERFPALVRTDFRALPALQQGASELDMNNRDAVMDAIRAHATDPSIFDTRDPFVWVAQISNNRTDYYFTRMDPATTLRNYAEDAAEGVAFLDSHISSNQPVGRSFASAIVESDDLVAVYAAFYTIPGLDNGKLSTDNLIDSIRSGLTKDVSVGFKRGEGFEKRCSICGGDMYMWDECVHFEGMTYSVPDERGNLTDKLCTAWIVNARLGEVSGVYDGATPTAMIEKAQTLAQRGVLREQQISSLERQLRVTLPHANSTFVVPGNEERSPLNDPQADSNRKAGAEAPQTNSEGENTMNGEGNAAGVLTSHVTGFENSLRSLGLIKDGEKDSSLDALSSRAVGEIERLRGIETQLVEYRDAEIADALTQGVRAMGDKFDNDRYKAILERSTLKEIRAFRVEWQEKADEELGGSRRSTEGNDDAAGDVENKAPEADADKRKAQREAPLLPDHLFRS